MIVENAAALNYIFQDEIYLLTTEKDQLATASEVTTDADPDSVAGLPVAEAKQVTESRAAQAIVEATPETTAPAPPPFAPKYLGQNSKRFLITTYYTQEEHINEAHLTALSAVLKRLNYDLADVAIINLYHHDSAIHTDLLSHFKPQRILVLGNKAIPPQSNIINLNKIETIADLKTLYSFSFDEMMTDVDKKRLFWEQVKNL